MGDTSKGPSSSPLLSPWFPLLPPDPYHPALSLLRDPEPIGFLSNSGASMDNPSSWNPVFSYDLVGKPVTPYSIWETSQHHDISALPPPPSYVAGEFEAYVGDVEHGNSETEAEQLGFGFLGPYPEPAFQAGELSEYEFILEHGNEERETEGDGFMPHYSFPSQGFWEFPAVFPSVGPRHPSFQRLEPSINHPVLPGPIPGAFSHFHSKYQTGEDFWDEGGYGRFHYPEVEHQTVYSEN